MEPAAATRFPHLFALADWGFAHARFALGAPLPPLHLIGNINLVPFVGADCLVIRLVDGRWEMPGGTLEPAEPYLETLRRELLEEAGACLVTFTPLGAWHCRSVEPRPYRPHLPHPEFYRLVGWGLVDLVGAPTSPAGAEQVAAVELVPPVDAARRFQATGRPDLADLYLLAAEARRAAEEPAP